MGRSLLFLALASLAACGPAANESTSTQPITGDVTFTTDDGEVRLNLLRLADSPEERAHGLMGVSELGRDEGMLFVYGEPSDGTFWMKDTLIPLDIAFWGSDGMVHTIEAMEPCTDANCPTYHAERSYTFALEMPAGWFARNGVEVGDRADARLLTY